MSLPGPIRRPQSAFERAPKPGHTSQRHTPGSSRQVRPP